MRAWMHHEFGGPEVMRLREVPVPVPGPDEILIRVDAVSLNPVDWKIMAGGPAAQNRGLRPPLGIANDVAGTVLEVGEQIGEWRPGDRVIASARCRALQECTVVAPGATALAHIPDSMDAGVAACVNIAARTAWAAVHDRLLEGETLYIHGGSGAVGQFAIQYAVAAGVRVIASGSSSRLERIRELGAEPVEYGEGLDARLAALAPVHAVLDCADGEGVRIGMQLGAPLERCTSISVKQAYGAKGVATDLEKTAPLQHLLDLVAGGAVDVEIGARYPFERAREAYESALAGAHRGKIVVDIDH